MNNGNKRRVENSGGGYRKSNIELYRIIGMLLIIAHHYVVNSGLTDVIYIDPFSGRSIYYLLFGAWGKTAINCFTMITGYYMCQSDISIKKWVKLLSTVMFYRILIGGIFWLTGYEPLSAVEALKLLIPIRSIKTNYTGCFLVFYLFIPFLSALVRNLNQKQHRLLIVLCGFTYIFFEMMPLFEITINYVSWFCAFFMIAAYIRLYPREIYENRRIWAIVLIIAVLAGILSVLLAIWAGEQFGFQMAYYFMSDSNNLLPVIIGISSFMFIKNVEIKYNRLINKIAASTFGVLCIHANSDTMRRWLWRDTLHNAEMYYSPYWFIYPIVCVLGVFAVCSVIDIIRSNTIERPWLDFIERKVISKTRIRLQQKDWI